MDILNAIIMGIVEGATEFLPVSSTGHLILTGTLLDFTGEAAKSFEIFIQLGAILAATILYWRRYLVVFGLAKNKERVAAGRPSLNLIHILLGVLPAGLLGLLLHDFIKDTLFSWNTVVFSLVIGGLFMIVADYATRKRRVTADEIDDLSYKQALGIGVYQCLALWPGFSRSGATISGGLLLGASKRASADFSFMMAIPLMLGATGVDLLKSYDQLRMEDMTFFLVGFFVALAVALIAVFTFLKLLQKLPWSAWAYYRFALAAVFWFFMMS
ncbi:MAG TPA: undecaprenyl-diphosphate phosphatase [Bacilli bacterium]|nr:undecaprenyl-diphosphate phosphatase [Bacilli bacterium]